MMVEIMMLVVTMMMMIVTIMMMIIWNTMIHLKQGVWKERDGGHVDSSGHV